MAKWNRLKVEESQGHRKEAQVLQPWEELRGSQPV